MNAVDVIVILLLGLILFFFFSFGHPLWKQIFGILNKNETPPSQTFSAGDFLQSPRIYSTPQWNTPPPFASFQLPWTRIPKTPPQTSVSSAPQFTERKTRTPSRDQSFALPHSQAYKDPSAYKSGATPGEAIEIDQTPLFPPQPMNEWTPASTAMDASETKSSSRKRYITQDQNTDEAKKLKAQSGKDERLSTTKRKVPKDTEDSNSTKHVKLSMDVPKKRKVPMLLLVLSVYPTSSQFLEEQKIPEKKIEEEEEEEEEVLEHGKDEVKIIPPEEPEEDIQTQEFLTPKSLSFSSPFRMEIKTTPSKTRSGRVRIPSKKKPQGTPMKSIPEDDENEENRIIAILKSASEKDGGK